MSVEWKYSDVDATATAQLSEKFRITVRRRTSKTFDVSGVSHDTVVKHSSIEGAQDFAIEFNRQQLAEILAALTPGEKPRYVPKLRPPGRSTLPDGVTWEYVEVPWCDVHLMPRLPVSDHRYGVIATNRALTKEEQARFDMIPWTGSDG